MASSLENIQLRLPGFYNKYDNRSALYTVIDACANIDEQRAEIIKRVDGAIGIDTTYDEDLEYRWGGLLSMPKNKSETYTAYRNRLKMAYPSLIGGTADAIKYAIASIIGISNSQTLVDDYVKVYDAWEYDGDAYIDPAVKAYGHIICTIDLSIGQNAFDIEQEILASINRVKASGIQPHILYLSFKIETYDEMSRFNYLTLGNVNYSDLG